MKLRAIHLFVILILSLVFCSCLGGSSIEGMSSGHVTKGQYTGPAGDTVYTYTNDNTSNSAAVHHGKHGNQVVTTSDNYDSYNQGETANFYYNAPTVKQHEIPPGDEDLYILKSQIVPPVCPACPSNASCPRQEPPPPCPPCARCPEPAFTCKKVPNYRANDPNTLPRPILTDFSTFGM